MIFRKSAFSWNQLLQFSIFSGMYYYEATVTDEGLCRVGWATDLASLDLGTMTVNWTSYKVIIMILLEWMKYILELHIIMEMGRRVMQWYDHLIPISEAWFSFPDLILLECGIMFDVFPYSCIWGFTSNSLFFFYSSTKTNTIK